MFKSQLEPSPLGYQTTALFVENIFDTVKKSKALKKSLSFDYSLSPSDDPVIKKRKTKQTPIKKAKKESPRKKTAVKKTKAAKETAKLAKKTKAKPRGNLTPRKYTRRIKKPETFTDNEIDIEAAFILSSISQRSFDSFYNRLSTSGSSQIVIQSPETRISHDVIMLDHNYWMRSEIQVEPEKSKAENLLINFTIAQEKPEEKIFSDVEIKKEMNNNENPQVDEQQKRENTQNIQENQSFEVKIEERIEEKKLIEDILMQNAGNKEKSVEKNEENLMKMSEYEEKLEKNDGKLKENEIKVEENIKKDNAFKEEIQNLQIKSEEFKGKCENIQEKSEILLGKFENPITKQENILKKYEILPKKIESFGNFLEKTDEQSMKVENLLENSHAFKTKSEKAKKKVKVIKGKTKKSVKRKLMDDFEGKAKTNARKNGGKSFGSLNKIAKKTEENGKVKEMEMKIQKVEEKTSIENSGKIQSKVKKIKKTSEVKSKKIEKKGKTKEKPKKVSIKIENEFKGKSEKLLKICNENSTTTQENDGNFVGNATEILRENFEDIERKSEENFKNFPRKDVENLDKNFKNIPHNLGNFGRKYEESYLITEENCLKTKENSEGNLKKTSQNAEEKYKNVEENVEKFSEEIRKKIDGNSKKIEENFDMKFEENFESFPRKTVENFERNFPENPENLDLIERKLGENVGKCVENFLKIEESFEEIQRKAEEEIERKAAEELARKAEELERQQEEELDRKNWEKVLDFHRVQLEKLVENNKKFAKRQENCEFSRFSSFCRSESSISTPAISSTFPVALNTFKFSTSLNEFSGKLTERTPFARSISLQHDTNPYKFGLEQKVSPAPKFAFQDATFCSKDPRLRLQAPQSPKKSENDTPKKKLSLSEYRRRVCSASSLELNS